MKTKNLLLFGFFPAATIVYGWYLNQFGESMQDLAGVLLLSTGVVGLAAAFGLGYAFRSQDWLKRWWVNLLLGLGGVVIGFGVIFVFARVTG